MGKSIEQLFQERRNNDWEFQQLGIDPITVWSKVAAPKPGGVTVKFTYKPDPNLDWKEIQEFVFGFVIK